LDDVKERSFTQRMNRDKGGRDEERRPRWSDGIIVNMYGKR